MEEIYQKFAELSPIRFESNPNVLTFDVLEIWRSHSTGLFRVIDRTIEVPNVASWLADEIAKDESLVLRLVWTNLDFNEKTVGLPQSVLSATLAKFGLRLAYRYSLTCVSGVNEFPKMIDAAQNSEHQAYALSYAPKLASVWSHTRFNDPSSPRKSVTNGIILAAEKQKLFLRALFHGQWQPKIATHSMFPAFLFTFMLGVEIEKTVAGMKPRIQEIETRTGYQSFQSKRNRAATGLLGVLSAEMSGSASRLASAERKGKTVQKLTDFIWQHSGARPVTAATLGSDPDGDSLMLNHTSVLKERLSMQVLDNAYTLKRVQLQIEALVNLIGQHDSINNTDIALSSHRDASSMKTLAVVTMFFLPGSFIAALFSTPCFDWDSVNPNNWSSIGVSATPQFNLYWAITIPMTLITFLLYFAWLQFQTSKRKVFFQSPASAHPDEIGGDKEELEEAKLIANKRKTTSG